jgi:DNA-binding winged helix-turn-helix (wHTH) protein
VIYTFGGYELDLDAHELRRSREVVRVEPQVFDVLAYLVEHRSRVVSKQELLDAVWRTSFVTEATLTSRIKAARQAVGDDGSAQRVIRTSHGRGYRFVAPVEAFAAAADEPQLGPEPNGHQPITQDIRFCRSADGVQVAYATSGSGPALVKDRQLAVAPGLRLGEPGLAALAAFAVPAPPAGPLRRARLRSLGLGRRATVVGQQDR